ncbi:hypothetical protein GCK72_017273 [Caenorhabditis remanei]|uniref:Myosin motor domain-containing protein n=1 Tax=Caenorhabditis remanei TaxID=31234 RepID=A0A6A5G7T8_CAERE|nr:hypothetical protein GCK72_017273 [Caenorhabditis remanei]KAF1750722.1 hypothetical protein GCK72_017273 [Caenorhabditis remanei]
MDGDATLGRGQVFSGQNYKKGARIWHRHPHLVWIGGVLEEDISFQTRQVRLKLEDDTTVEYDITSLEQLPFLRNPAFLVGKDDLTLLSYLHEPAVLHNLQVRFVNSQSIYTYCGIVLVAINPYADCSHIYREEIIQVYQGAGGEEAHFDMGAFGKSQSIIVSGESGAGKTVSAKFVMRYLASVAASRSRSDQGRTTIEARVLASNPIMESIGNVKTIRNDNSSRFGTFIQINFCERGRRIIGAEMKTYLLEKSRLVFQAGGERNYHVFYQMCAARNHPVLKDLHLGPCEAYGYLTQGGDSRIPGVDDRADFEELLKALQMLGFDGKQISEVFRLLAGLLLLGNVHFENGESSSAVSPESAQEISRLCREMWEISEGDLRVWLTRREIRAVNEVVTKPLTKNEAVRSRDALTKMLYAHLFGWLVEKINEALNDKEKAPSPSKKRSDRFIGVLDIYGFETFDINSFEQFSINYANEKLQQQFNQHVEKNRDSIGEKLLDVMVAANIQTMRTVIGPAAVSSGAKSIPITFSSSQNPSTSFIMMIIMTFFVSPVCASDPYVYIKNLGELEKLCLMLLIFGALGWLSLTNYVFCIEEEIIPRNRARVRGNESIEMSTISALLLGMIVIFGAVCATAGRVEIFSISIILVLFYLFTFLVSLANDEDQHGLQRDHSGVLGILNTVSKNTKPYLLSTVFSTALLAFCSEHIIEPYQSIFGAMGLILLLFSQIFLLHTAYKSSRRAID